MSDRLVRPDGVGEHHALVRVPDRPLETPATGADRFRGYRQAFRIEPVEECGQTLRFSFDKLRMTTPHK